MTSGLICGLDLLDLIISISAGQLDAIAGSAGTRKAPRSVRITPADGDDADGGAAASPAAPTEDGPAATRRAAGGAAKWLQTARQAGAARLRSLSQRRLPAERAPPVSAYALHGQSRLRVFNVRACRGWRDRTGPRFGALPVLEAAEVSGIAASQPATHLPLARSSRFPGG